MEGVSLAIKNTDVIEKADKHADSNNWFVVSTASDVCTIILTREYW